MTDTIHSCSPFCTLPACVKQREHQDFQAWHGGIYAGRQKEIAFGAWQTATERATAIERERCAVVVEAMTERRRMNSSQKPDCEYAKAIRQGGAE